MRLHSGLPLLALMAALGAESVCVPQERITGRVTAVTDGDSFEMGTMRVRLFGIDAPEGRQACSRDTRDWACGDEAQRKLRNLIGNRTVACTQRDVDDYQRIVAVCRSGNVDVGEEMVRSGFATAYRRFSNDYVDEEADARSARRGIWAGEFMAPETYRNEQRRVERERAAPEQQARRVGCDIKGNISADGDRIYHTTDSASYRDTEIDESKGERWFCTAGEARAAGWRAPRQRGPR